MITALELLPGNAWDSAGALELVERSEAGAGVPVTEAMGDAAYGDGGTRQAFAGAGRTLIAKAPGRPNTARFPKEDFRRTSGGLPEDFRIDLEACTCPAGQVTRGMRKAERRTDLTGRTYKLTGFQFEGSGVWSVLSAAPVRGGGAGHRPDGAAAPSRSPIATGARLTAE